MSEADKDMSAETAGLDFIRTIVTEDLASGDHSPRIVNHTPNPGASPLGGKIQPYSDGWHDEDQDNGAYEHPGDHVTHFLGVALNGPTSRNGC